MQHKLSSLNLDTIFLVKRFFPFIERILSRMRD